MSIVRHRVKLLGMEWVVSADITKESMEIIDLKLPRTLIIVHGSALSPEEVKLIEALLDAAEEGRMERC